MNLDLILTGVIQGLLLALVAYAVMVPFRLLNFPDLTAEGAYPFGGALGASSLLLGLHPILSLLIATLGAGCLGVLTSQIYLRLKINTLLAGIIVSTMAYSLNLRTLGKPNVAMFDTAVLFMPNNTLHTISLLFGILLVMVLPLTLFLHTELGLKLRAVGLNPTFAKRQGINIQHYTMLGLFIAGGFSGLAGGLIVQVQSYMDVGMGIGIVMHALAALMIGEQLIGTQTLSKQCLAPLVGALVYQQVQGVVLSLGMAPSDLKFFTGACVLLILALQRRSPDA